MLCIRHCFSQWTLTSSLIHGGRVSQQAPDKHSEMSAFLFVFLGTDPCGDATMLRIRHCFSQWTLTSSRLYGGQSLNVCKPDYSVEWFFCCLFWETPPLATPTRYAYDIAFALGVPFLCASTSTSLYYMSMVESLICAKQTTKHC